MPVMPDKEKKILENFSRVLPLLDESDKSYLLGLGEGLAVKVEWNGQHQQSEQRQELTVVG